MSSGFQRKILGLDELLTAVADARKAGKTVVQCHGCFDIVHPGHIRYLEFARQQGDVLIVSLTGDSQISKGDSRPYIPQALRAENLAALVFVDHVYIDPSPTARNLLARIKPDVYVKGREYEHSTDPGFLAEKGVVESYGGRMIFSSGEVVFSSTELIESAFGHSPGDDAESRRLALLTQRYNLSPASIEEALGRFRNLRALVVGDVLIDRYVFCDALGIASESPVISLAQRDERRFVGGAAIVARHIAALGGRASFLGAVGNDRESAEVADLLRNEGIESHLMHLRPGIVQKSRFLADDSKLFKVDEGNAFPLDSVAERKAAAIIEQQCARADVLILCDFGYGMITGGLLARVLPTIRHNVRTLAADVSGGRASLLSFRHVDLLCPTERELRATLNDYDSGLSAVAWRMLEKTQARHLFVTLGERGMVVFGRRSQDRTSPDWSGRLRSEQLPSFAHHAVDRLGCGDALLAAATLSLASGCSLMEAAYIGNAAAAAEISMLGNHPVTTAQLRESFRRDPGLGPSLLAEHQAPVVHTAMPARSRQDAAGRVPSSVTRRPDAPT
ncbi:MAG: PfkB family carbohydrate kinase [Phycisphaerae bacterium]|jgi:rfaE bifunctional protein kinase chain/domain/rfaE bifunctional protein nucleotidyltransferase chain/domain